MDTHNLWPIFPQNNNKTKLGYFIFPVATLKKDWLEVAFQQLRPDLSTIWNVDIFYFVVSSPSRQLVPSFHRLVTQTDLRAKGKKHQKGSFHVDNKNVATGWQLRSWAIACSIQKKRPSPVSSYINAAYCTFPQQPRPILNRLIPPSHRCESAISQQQATDDFKNSNQILTNNLGGKNCA